MVIDADGSHVQTVVAGDRLHGRHRFSPDGRRLVFQSDRAGLLAAVWVVDIDGGPSQLRVCDLDGGNLTRVDVPPVAAILSLGTLAADEVVYALESFTQPRVWWRAISPASFRACQASSSRTAPVPAAWGRRTASISMPTRTAP